MAWTQISFTIRFTVDFLSTDWPTSKATTPIPPPATIRSVLSKVAELVARPDITCFDVHQDTPGRLSHVRLRPLEISTLLFQTSISGRAEMEVLLDFADWNREPCLIRWDLGCSTWKVLNTAMERVTILALRIDCITSSREQMSLLIVV